MRKQLNIYKNVNEQDIAYQNKLRIVKESLTNHKDGKMKMMMKVH